MRNKKVLQLVQFSLLLAIEVIFCFTPLGSLPAIGPVVATLAHIPVIITAISMGTTAGTLMGLAFGLMSVFKWSFMPPNPLLAFVFTPFYSLGQIHGNIGSLLISVVPRTLIGTVAGVVAKKFEGKSFGFELAGLLGTLTNTFLVMGGIYVFFGAQYADVLKLSNASSALLYAIWLTILTNGIPEAIVGAICARFIGKPLRKINARNIT
jgi:uncharacterized membrane protein